VYKPVKFSLENPWNPKPCSKSVSFKNFGVGTELVDEVADDWDVVVPDGVSDVGDADSVGVGVSELNSNPYVSA
jgi:hypothetical protein